MAFRPLLRQRAMMPAAATVVAAGSLLYPRRTVAAESLETTDSRPIRKPIYDDYTPPTPPAAFSSSLEGTTPTTTSPTASSSSALVTPPTSSTGPSPTDRLAVQIKNARLALHSYAARAEDGVNDLLTSFFHLEHSFTSTVASLAPPKESNEKLLPGSIYVLVAALAGSIVTRNRNILLRATFPVAVGVGAGYAVLPITTRNVGDLIWSYEERYPVVRDNHLRVRNAVSHFVQTGIAHSQMGKAMAEEKVQGVVEAVEEWVKKGR